MARRAAKRGALLVDTNLLVLLIVGSLDIEQVERFKRTRAYSREDYALLAAFAAGFRRMLTTPNVLTEVSNLVGQLGEPLRRRALVALGILAGQFEERFRASRELVLEPSFPRLGLTDSSVIFAAEAEVTVLTDLDLYVRLSSSGVTSINFNHLRSGSCR